MLVNRLLETVLVNNPDDAVGIQEKPCKGLKLIYSQYQTWHNVVGIQEKPCKGLKLIYPCCGIQYAYGRNSRETL